MTDLGIHIIDTPSGEFAFAGSVPASLAYVAPDGSPITDEQAQTARAFGPRLAGVKTRVFTTREDAEAALAAYEAAK